MSRLKEVCFGLALVSCLLVLVRSQSSLTLVSNVNIAFTNNGVSTQFTVTSPLGNSISVSNAWIGIGFNSQAKMSGGSVIMCLNGGSSAVQHYYNTGYTTALLDSTNPTLGISSASISIDSSNNLVCKFTRDNSNSNSKYFNVSSASPYIQAAYGSISSGSPNKHAARESTTSTVSFGAATTTTQTTTTIAQSTVTKLPGTYYGSFAAQGYLLSWVDTPTYTDFTFTSPSLSSGRKKRDVTVTGLSNIYISFGLSTDDEMGNDDVIACKVSGNVGTVERYYNPSSGAPIYMDSSNPTLGLSNSNIMSNNSALFCSFRRDKATNGLSRYFDLNNNYYILVAQGVVQSSNLVYHGTSRFASGSAINFQANSNSSGSGIQNNDKAKAHGALMVFAWMLIASTGILFARYYRFLDSEILKKPIWFQVHRGLMLSVPVISIVSFLVILSDLQWKWVSQTVSLNFAHSIIGIVTIGLSFIQVIIAFFRPHPGTPRRPIFNYFHRSVGLSALILSIVSIFLGVCINRMNMNQSGWGIMIGWTIWVIVLPILLEIVQVAFTTTKTHSETFHINDKKEIKSVDDNEKNKKFIESVKKLFIPFHLVAAVAFTVALIVVIALSKPPNTA